MKICKDCGATYYKVRRDDLGICDGCRDAAAAAARAANARRRAQGEPASGRYLPAYRQETREAVDAFYAKKRKRRKRKK